MKTKETSNPLGKTYDEIEQSRSTREQALAWWNNKSNYSHESENSKEAMYNKYFVKGNLFTIARFYNELTGREIEEIWRKETQEYDYSKLPMNPNPNLPNWMNSKPNQKQFKQFDESLFKAYIDKFSDDSKLKAFRFLYKEVLKYYSIDPQIEHNKALGLHE